MGSLNEGVRMTAIIRAALISLVVLSVGRTAAAQSIDGALRLHLETGFLGFQSETTNEDGPPPSETTKTVTFGPGTTGLGFGLGYGISDNLVIGGNVTLQYISIDPEGPGSGTGSNITLIPYIEVLFGSGSVRPFVGGALLLSSDSFEDRSTALFGLAGIGGAHIFITDSYSLDLGGRLFFVAGSSSHDTGGGSVDTSISRVGLIALIGVSGWSS